MRRASLVLGAVAGCTLSRPLPPPPVPSFPAIVDAPRAPDVPRDRRAPVEPVVARDGGAAPATWLDHVVQLRTSLGRAGIRLELGGEHDTISSGCGGDTPRHCIRCTLGDEATGVPGPALGVLARELDRYPAGWFLAARIQRVALCRTLELEDKYLLGVADPGWRRLFVRVQPVDEGPGYSTALLRSTIHHEVFHLVDDAMGHLRADPEWVALDPVRGVDLALGGRTTTRSAGAGAGYVNAYAATSHVEDRASVFEYLMSDPDRLCALVADDAVIAAKARLLWQRLEAFGAIGFLRTTVPCAATLEPAP